MTGRVLRLAIALAAARVRPRAMVEQSHCGYSENPGWQAEPFCAHTPRRRWKTQPLRALADGQRPAGNVVALDPRGHKRCGEEPLSQYFINILSDFKPEEAPIRPAAAALFLQRAKNFSNVSPLSHCLPEGMPLVEMAPAPYKIVQTPGLTLMLYERDTTFRQVYTDGRKLPDDPQPSWLGYSVGKWDGDTLVVERSASMTGDGWTRVATRIARRCT